MINVKDFAVPLLGALLVVAGGAAVYFYTQAPMLKDSSAVASQKEVSNLVAEVGALIALPEGEVPTVATVSDPEKLAGQPFFANAKVGYKVLIYSAARRAYLYDPAQHKLIEVAPINIGAAQ